MNARALILALCTASSVAPACDGHKDDNKRGNAKADATKKDAKASVKADAKGDPKADDAKADANAADASADPKADPKADDAKADAGAPKVVACDQRDFIPEGDKKMAAQLGKEPKPKLVCMDYSKRTAGVGAASCAQGDALDTPCPDQDVVATCTMEKTGTVYKHYKGANLATAERMCKTMEGVFGKS